MDALYTFLDNITHYKTKSVHFWELMNSATKIGCYRHGQLMGFREFSMGFSRASQGVWGSMGWGGATRFCAGSLYLYCFCSTNLGLTRGYYIRELGPISRY